jgi:hypothetical protein
MSTIGGRGKFGIGKRVSPIVVDGLILHLDAGNSLSYSGSGVNWYDISGNANTATLINGPTYSSANGGSIVFNDATLQHGNITNIGNKNVWSVEVWFKISSSLTGKVSSILTNRYDLSTKLNFSIGTNNSPSSYKLCVGFFDGSWHNTTGFDPSLNTWYQVVGTYDGTTLRQYVNGTSSGGTLNYVGTPQSGGDIRLMRRWDDVSVSSNYINGNLSNAKIYNRALSASEVTKNYNALKSRYF